MSATRTLLSVLMKQEWFVPRAAGFVSDRFVGSMKNLDNLSVQLSAFCAAAGAESTVIVLYR